VISKIKIENFKSFLSSSIDLGPFNVLIGPNDSGKTNLLEAFRLLKNIAWGKEKLSLLPYDFIHSLIPNARPYIKFTLEFTINSDNLSYSVTLEKSEKGLIFSEENLLNTISNKFYLRRNKDEIYALNEVAQEEEKKTFESTQAALPLLTDLKTNKHAWLTTQRFRDIWFYNLNTERMKEFYRLPPESEGEEILSENGNNILSVLHKLSTAHKENYDRLKELMKKEIPYLSDLEVREAKIGEKVIENYLYLWLEFNGKYGLFGKTVSDGFIKFLGILTLVCSPRSAPQINIEEIENHIHPHRLESTIDCLRSLIYRKDPSQIILTTHSPNVLNLVTPKEVLIVERGPNQESTITPLIKKSQILDFLKEMPIGEAWLSRIIGGVP
jgi:predicted ATPase